MPWYRQLHWQIVIGLITGLAFGLIASSLGWGWFVTDWVKPWGTIFINLLKLIAVPLVLASLISGVASLSDLSKLSRIGGKTIGIYIATTAIAVTIGLVVVNVFQPGKVVSAETTREMQARYAARAEEQTSRAEEVDPVLKARREAAGLLALAVAGGGPAPGQPLSTAGLIAQADTTLEAAPRRSPLQFLVDIVPENLFASASANANLLQVVFVALLIGVGLILVDPAKGAPVRAFFEGFNEVIIQMVNLIMLIAPVGVFALIAGVIVDVAGDDPRKAVELLSALGFYGGVVILGLICHICLVYLPLLKLFTSVGIGQFFRALRPAQLLAFSTSSSAATLPVTKECTERGLGVSSEITSFTLPLGATINMDGTALYQAVAAVFIAQVNGLGLGVGAQLTIILTATLASIGSAAVPGAGVIMLVIILQAIGVPVGGIGLILGIDRILDMCRTVTNVTGDAVVTTVVAKTESKIGKPAPGGPIPEPDLTSAFHHESDHPDGIVKDPQAPPSTTLESDPSKKGTGG
jgi:proton glutamate symport protein